MPRRHAAVDAMPVEPPDVRQQGERTFQGVGVGLDHPRDDHVVGEPSVDGVRPPARAFVDRTGGEHPSVAHRDGLDPRLRRIHRDDRPRRKDGDLAHHRQRTLPPLTRRLWQTP